MNEISELDGWQVGDTVTVGTDERVGVIKRIDPSHGLGRWPYLVVYPTREFTWSTGEWLTRVDELRTKSRRILTHADIERLADEAERGYDVSWQEPTLPEVWVAELLTGKDALEPGRVVTRVILTSRAEAELALAAHWRIVRYVRADHG